MATYLLRNVPDELWEQVKAKADSDGLDARTVILLLLKHYAEHGLIFRLATKPMRSRDTQ
jgi:hypothetical protein